MAHNLRLASWEAGTPASFEAHLRGRSTRSGGFSCALRRRDAALPKPVEWLPVASSIKIADNLVQRGNVFTPGPSPGNPYVIAFSRYSLSILSARMKSGNTGAKAERRLTPWVETAGACGGLKPSCVRIGEFLCCPVKPESHAQESKNTKNGKT